MLELARKLDEDRRDCTASCGLVPRRPSPLAGAAAGPPARLLSRPTIADDRASRSWRRLEELLARRARAAPGRRSQTLASRRPSPHGRRAARRRRARGLQRGRPAAGGGGLRCRRRRERRACTPRDAAALCSPRPLPAGGRPRPALPERAAASAAGSTWCAIASGLPQPPPVLLMSETIDEKLLGRARRLGVSLLSFKPGPVQARPAAVRGGPAGVRRQARARPAAAAAGTPRRHAARGAAGCRSRPRRRHGRRLSAPRSRRSRPIPTPTWSPSCC